MINNAVEVEAPSTGVVKIELAIGTATQRLADAEASLEQQRAKRRRALVGDGADELQTRRKAALADGDEGEVDRLDAEIGNAIDRLDVDFAKAEKIVTRERDRLQVLHEDLAEAKTVEQQRSMDELFNRADAARKIGEKLIQEDYAEASAKIVTILSKLVAINEFIRRTNMALAEQQTKAAAGASPTRRVGSPNSIRDVPTRVIPAHTREVERYVCNGNSFPRNYAIEKVVETVAEQKSDGRWLPELPEVCVIAPAADGAPSWDNKFHGEETALLKRYDEIVDSLV